MISCTSIVSQTGDSLFGFLRDEGEVHIVEFRIIKTSDVDYVLDRVLDLTSERLVILPNRFDIWVQDVLPGYLVTNQGPLFETELLAEAHRDLHFRKLP